MKEWKLDEQYYRISNVASCISGFEVVRNINYGLSFTDNNPLLHNHVWQLQQSTDFEAKRRSLQRQQSHNILLGQSRKRKRSESEQNLIVLPRLSEQDYHSFCEIIDHFNLFSFVSKHTFDDNTF